MTDGRVLGWDDEIQEDSKGWEPLPAGEYDFRVLTVERGQHNGSGKLPPCPKAIVTLEVEHEGQLHKIKNQLFLHSRTEGLLSAFFGSIGQKKHGEPLKMNWATVEGSAGRAKIAPRKYTGSDGNEYVTDDIKQFIYKDDAKPAAQQQGFTPGQF